MGASMLPGHVRFDLILHFPSARDLGSDNGHRIKVYPRLPEALCEILPNALYLLPYRSTACSRTQDGTASRV